MHLKIQKRGDRAYLSVVQNYRQNGRTRTRTIETIGYADAYADQYDDPIAHFRAYVEELNQQKMASEAPIELSFRQDDTIENAALPAARLGSAIALGCLDAIGVRTFFESRAGHKGFPKHVGRIFEMLASERMMHVTSKRESWATRASFPRTCPFTYADVYAALPCLAREEKHLAAHLRRTRERINGPLRTDCIYVVCGTYPFPDAEQQSGARASIAVALDVAGVPLDYHVVDSRFDAALLAETVALLKTQLDAKHAVAIVGSSRKAASYMKVLAERGFGFVVPQLLRDADDDLTRWMEDDAEYVEASPSASMKSRVRDRILSETISLPVREIVLRGAEYTLPHGSIAIVSSETDLSEHMVVQLFRELWRQSEPFQALEADFSAMPVPTPLHDHVHAHFAICYASFFALRMLRQKMGWTHNAAAVADALLNMEGTYLQRNYYLFNYRTEVTDRIEESLGIPQARRLRTQAELRSIPGIVRNAMEA